MDLEFDTDLRNWNLTLICGCLLHGYLVSPDEEGEGVDGVEKDDRDDNVEDKVGGEPPG